MEQRKRLFGLLWKRTISRPSLGQITVCEESEGAKTPNGRPRHPSAAPEIKRQPETRRSRSVAKPIIAGDGAAFQRGSVEASRNLKPQPPESPSVPDKLLTASQRGVLAELTDRAELFFESVQKPAGGIPLQTNTLLLGPTGCGKTTVVDALARQIGAECFKVSHGNWIVDGASRESGEPTVTSIVSSACRARRVVLFIDELDKFFQVHDSSSWHCSVLNDLWLLLDRSLNWGRLLAKTEISQHLDQDSRSIAHVEACVRRRIFIVGAGTWQSLMKPSVRIGFGSPAPDSSASDIMRIIRHGALPEEVLRRFNYDTLKLAYPSQRELGEMLRRDTALAQALATLGAEPDVVMLREQMESIGMTALTTYKTNTLLAARRSARCR